MKLYFWQNIISPHQIPYIKNLAKQEKVGSVFLIVAESLSEERNKMGWNLESSEDINVIISPSEDHILEIYRNSKIDTIHYYSGIRSFPFVYNSFKISLGFKLNRGLIVEHPFTYKKPIILHFLRTLILDYTFLKKFKFVFAFGNKATQWYSMWNSHYKVIPFIYCVAPPTYKTNENKEIVKIVFIGSLIPRKNVKVILESIKNLRHESFQIDIIGDGPQRIYLENLCRNYNLTHKVMFHGTRERQVILNSLTNYDILILPSLFDGWGAVVNEALMAGLFVICSNKCGAQALIDADRKRGLIFDAKSKKDLAEKLNWSISNINTIRSQKEQRHKWSECISGESVADYFVKSLGESTVTPPWADHKN